MTFTLCIIIPCSTCTQQIDTTCCHLLTCHQMSPSPRSGTIERCQIKPEPLAPGCSISCVAHINAGRAKRPAHQMCTFHMNTTHITRWMELHSAHAQLAQSRWVRTYISMLAAQAHQICTFHMNTTHNSLDGTTQCARTANRSHTTIFCTSHIHAGRAK